MKPKLLPVKAPDPLLSAYDIIDTETRIVWGSVAQYWHQSVYMTSTRGTYKKTRRWMGIRLSRKTSFYNDAGIPTVKSCKTRKEAVAFVTEDP